MIGGEVVSAQPVLTDDDRIGRDRANLLDEAGEMERDLGIGGTVAGFSGSDGLGLAQPIDLHHPGHDMPARRLPHDTGGKTAGERQRAEESEAPVPCLNTRGADAVVP